MVKRVAGMKRDRKGKSWERGKDDKESEKKGALPQVIPNVYTSCVRIWGEIFV